MTIKTRLALAIGGGAVAGLSVHPFGVPLLMIAGMIAGLAGFVRAPNWWQAGLSGWLFMTAYFCVAWVWLLEPFQVEAERYGWMAPFALVLLSIGMAFYAGAGFALAHRLGRTPALRLALVVPAFCLAELTRAYAFTGFIWTMPAQAWIDDGVALWLAWFGPYLLSAMTLACAAMIVAVWPRGWRARVLSAVPLAALWVSGQALWLTAPDTETGPHTVRLLQPNAPQTEKWDRAVNNVFYERLIDYTSQPGADLIVWPETALTQLLNYAGAELAEIADAANGVPVVVGAQRMDQKRFYNSLVALDDQGRITDQYDKHHLVPFGEFVPFGDQMARWFGITGLAANEGAGFSSGPGPQLMDFGAVGRALPLICYEGVFPHDARGTPERADFLIQPTNDAWFGTASGPRQHLEQARMRAIETGLPMLRAANTGISAAIDPQGRVLASLPIGEAGYIDAPLPRAVEKTLYAHTGDWPALILSLLLIAGLALRNRV